MVAYMSHILGVHPVLEKLTNLLRLGRGVEYRSTPTVGWFAHEQGVRRMVESFKEIPRDKQVRLAKRTSNLFRGRDDAAQGLDVSGLSGVIAVDPVERTADVQGMCTYEDLVDATLPFGLIPTVVPQLKTITLGGAVTGMGVESSSFRLGLPHEAVLEMDILTGTGDVVNCSPTKNVDLYRGFPNSYGSLGYAVRLKVRLAPAPKYVSLRHVRYHDPETLARDLEKIATEKNYQGEEVDFLDGVAFSPEEAYLTLGTGTDEPGPVSDYTRSKIYYRSMQHPDGVLRDRLTLRDYLWRWDIDWFWCSRAFGAQTPLGRALWPRDLRRSSFYWKLVGLDRKYDIEHRFTTGRRGEPHRERVVQDIEVTCDKLPEWLRWFFSASDIQPMWLCPITLRDESAQLVGTGEVLAESQSPWPLYPLDTDTVWVNAGFWSAVPGDLVSPEAKPGAFNRVIEKKVDELGGHKSLYSEAFYTREQFARLYGGELPGELKGRFDPDSRFPGLYEKTVDGA